MTGVTILNSYLVNGVPLAILLFVIGIIIFVCCIRDFIKDENACGAILLVLSLGVMAFGVGCFMAPSTTHHEVTISDDVPFKEFQEHYKIVTQRGDIYVVEERADANG